MKPEEVRVAVLRIEGTNCEDESALAWEMAGAVPEKVHLNQLVGKTAAEDRRSLEEYHILMIPGGFSAGDYVRAGAIFAARLRAFLEKEIVRFVEEGKPVLGVCNGFQVLVELGLLPGFDGKMSPVPVASLMTNDSARFECRPTLLKHENRGKCVFSSKLLEKPRDAIYRIPSAHAEGKLVFAGEHEEELFRRLFENDQVVFRYVDPEGEYAGYPWNPNGTRYNVAGICNAHGNVMGMMPHPERALYRYLHSDWTRFRGRAGGGSGDEKGGGVLNDVGDGLAVFESAVDYVTRKF